MRYLLIDNSNTRTKFAIGSEAGLENWRAQLLTKEITSKSLHKLTDMEHFDAVMLCSVVPEKAAIIAKHFHSYPFHQLDHKTKMGIRIDYPKPEQIGADRLANAMGVDALYGSPAVVIDLGTAVTFDVVGPNTTYLGGVIAPGLASMTDNLAKRTALLPRIELTEPMHAIGKSTSEAMLVGAIYGYRGMIKEILKKICHEMTSKPTIVATGGDAQLIAKGLPEVDHVCPILTLEGIRIAATLQF